MDGMPMGHGSLVASSYDGRLVALSVVIASVAAYVALTLAERVAKKRGGLRVRWLVGGATVMGCGIWSMHFTGMLALQLSIPVSTTSGSSPSRSSRRSLQ